VPKNQTLLLRILQILSSRVVYTLLSFILIVGGSYLAIQYARGSWRVTNTGLVANTGMLNVNSFPTGAQVFISDRLVSATDDTIYLQPDIYRVRIVKEGYSPWIKDLTVQSQLVTQTNALLFPIAPSITPLTVTGARNIHPSPDGQKIAFFTDQAGTTARNGFYVLDLNSNFLSLQSGSRQLTDAPAGWELAEADVIWSPDSSELMILTETREVLIGADKKINLADQTDITFQKADILSTWEKEIYLREQQFLARFPEEIQQIATQSAGNVYISPDKKRLLYTATASAILSENLIPPVPAANNQPEERELVIGGIYVYDREEDRNFRLATARPVTSDEDSSATDEEDAQEAAQAALSAALTQKSLLHYQPEASLEASLAAFTRLQATSSAETARNFASYYSSLHYNSLQWFPTSKHILFINEGKIQIMEYDGYNVTTVYSGPFTDSFVYPWPDGSKLIIQTSFSPDSPPNLYAIDLRK
jgi:hypothetical protein